MIQRPSNSQPRREMPPNQSGFTILELTVVMGLLSVFMMFLLQILFTSTGIFQEGQDGQDLSTRALAASRALETAVGDMTGPTRESRTSSSNTRMLCQWEPLGFIEGEAQTDTQVLRATVRIDKEQEKALLRELLIASGEFLAVEDYALEETLELMVAMAGYGGRGDMLLLPWPQGDAEGAYTQLRHGLFLPERAMPFPEADGRSLMELDRVGDLPPDLVRDHTTVLASGLLHVSFEFASQYTRGWSDPVRGPETVWDSSRVGWPEVEGSADPSFSLTMGEASRYDSTDDVFPRVVRLTVVAGMSPQHAPESLLADGLAAGQVTSVRLASIENLPLTIHDNLVKIGSEWIRFAEIDGDVLKGLARGQRGTQAKTHERGTGVRVGRTQVILIRLLHGRDSWNG